MPHHFPFVLVALGLLFIYIVVVLAIGVPATSCDPKSYLVEEPASVMQFRAPAGQRLALRMVTGVFVLMGIYFLLWAQTVSNPVPIYFFVIPDTLIVAATLLYLSGPSDVRLDAGSRTYEWTVGWPWQPQIRRGTFDDIRGIQTTQQGGVVLLMRQRAGIRSQVVLGSRMGTKATALAQKVSQATGIPVVSSR